MKAKCRYEFCLFYSCLYLHLLQFRDVLIARNRRPNQDKLYFFKIRKHENLLAHRHHSVPNSAQEPICVIVWPPLHILDIMALISSKASLSAPKMPTSNNWGRVLPYLHLSRKRAVYFPAFSAKFPGVHSDWTSLDKPMSLDQCSVEQRAD